MNVRALAIVAVLLGAMVLGAGFLLLDRLGYLEEIEVPQIVFENPTLNVERGQRVLIRPLVESGEWRRYTFLVAVVEPQPDDPIYPAPHLRAGVEGRAEDGRWYRLPFGEFVQPLAMGQMGAATIQEWLHEIRPVLEVDGDQKRLLMRVTFGHTNGGVHAYFFDPEHKVPAFGWIRREIHSPQGGAPEIHFATPAGKVEVTK